MQQFKCYLGRVEEDQRVLLVPFLNCEPQTEIIREVMCVSFGMEVAFLLYHGN